MILAAMPPQPFGFARDFAPIVLATALPFDGSSSCTPASISTCSKPVVPTIAESGVPGYEMDAWVGVLAPAGTPRLVTERLNAAFNRALAVPAAREKLGAQALDVVGGTPEAFAKVIGADLQKYSRVVSAAGIKPG